eukprot:GHVU01116462.1.p1 GENE.GHVU01116462.1~~GHVU01116462.1.p1  ORF type:complete len:521 (+),score=19.97 GHVU01116462.1:357-1919(+)
MESNLYNRRRRNVVSAGNPAEPVYETDRHIDEDEWSETLSSVQDDDGMGTPRYNSESSPANPRDSSLQRLKESLELQSMVMSELTESVNRMLGSPDNNTRISPKRIPKVGGVKTPPSVVRPESGYQRTHNISRIVDRKAKSPPPRRYGNTPKSSVRANPNTSLAVSSEALAQNVPSSSSRANPIPKTTFGSGLEIQDHEMAEAIGPYEGIIETRRQLSEGRPSTNRHPTIRSPSVTGKHSSVPPFSSFKRLQWMPSEASSSNLRKINDHGRVRGSENREQRSSTRITEVLDRPTDAPVPILGRVKNSGKDMTLATPRIYRSLGLQDMEVSCPKMEKFTGELWGPPPRQWLKLLLSLLENTPDEFDDDAILGFIEQHVDSSALRWLVAYRPLINTLDDFLYYFKERHILSPALRLAESYSIVQQEGETVQQFYERFCQFCLYTGLEGNQEIDEANLVVDPHEPIRQGSVQSITLVLSGKHSPGRHTTHHSFARVCGYSKLFTHESCVPRKECNYKSFRTPQ